jgi:hypothetical protein
MDLMDRDHKGKVAESKMLLLNAYGWAVLLAAGIVAALGILEAVEGGPHLLWPVLLANGLAVLGVELFRIRDRRAISLARMDMQPEHGALMTGLRLRTSRAYRTLAVAHGASALLLAGFYGVRALMGTPSAGQGKPACFAVPALALLAGIAAWRSVSEKAGVADQDQATAR